MTSYIKGLEANLEIRSEQLKEESTTHGREITTLKSKFESATQNHEGNGVRIRALESASSKPEGDLINSILTRLTRLEGNQK